MMPVNRVLLNEALSDFNVEIMSSGLSCNSNQSSLNVAVYRMTILPASPPSSIDLASSRRKRDATSSTFDVELIQESIRVWALMGQEIQLDDESFVKVDLSCTTEILSLDDPLCMLVPTALGQRSSGEGAAVSDGGVAAIVLALVLVVVGVICVIFLVVFLYVTKKDSKK